MDQKRTPTRDSLTAPADAARDADLLDGWKDIADYLGKSVRTAQRWEAEFSLPVHRLGGRDGEGIYAYRSEIDRWRRGSARPPEAHLPATGSNELQPEQPDGHGVGTRLTEQRGRGLWRVVGVLVFVAAIVAVIAFTLGQSGQPASVKVTPRGFAVFDAKGRQLWEKPVAAPLAIAELASNQPLAGTGDVDGDGDQEVLVAFHGSGQRSHVTCYDSRGRERWTYRPTDTAEFGGRRVGAPVISYLILHRRPDGLTVPYVTSTHDSQFPSLVARIGPDGTPTARYWSAGHVVAFRIMPIGGRTWVFVGAPHNESKGGSLAVFDERRFGGSAPAGNDTYRCTACPAGAPDFFFVFPRTSISRLFGFAPVAQLNPDDDGFSVSVSHHTVRLPGENRVVVGLAHYRFDARFNLIAGDYTRDYYAIESFLVAEKLIPKATAQYDKSELWPVEVWSAGHWKSVSR